jgi:hypothetical protein
LAAQNYPVILTCLALALATLAVFFQVGDHQFLSFDDKQYVTETPHIVGGLTGKNILWAFTSVEAFNWHPLLPAHPSGHFRQLSDQFQPGSRPG